MTVCDVCGEEMSDKGKKIANLVGIEIWLDDRDISEHKEAKRFKETFGVDKFSVCLVCVARALGLKEVKKFGR